MSKDTTAEASGTTDSKSTDLSSAWSCTILWSTQSGRAKACARRTCRILRQSTCVEPVVVGGSLDDYGFSRILQDAAQPRSSRHLWVLLISTTGDGEQCDSMRQTWTALLNKSLPSDLLQRETFALFALGDRAYGPQFCAGGRKLAARWVQLGATPFLPLGYGDDGTPNGGVFADLDDWLQQTLLPALPPRAEPISHDKLVSRHGCARVVVSDEKEEKQEREISTEEWKRLEYQEFFANSCPITAYAYGSHSMTAPPLAGCIESNQRLTHVDWEQDTRHITIQVCGRRQDGSTLPYQAGDIATVMPVNSGIDVNRLLEVLPPNIESLADQELEIECLNSNFSGEHKQKWPLRFTLRGLLTYAADIQALPEREDLWELSFYCNLEHAMGEDQRDKLVALSGTSEAALYADYVLREKRTWADVLYDFDAVQLTSVDDLLHFLQPMRPRDFSIASAPTPSIRENGVFDVELCVALVEGTTPLKRSYHGLCSSYLRNLQESDPIQLWIRPGSFGQLPLQLNEKGRFVTPLLCIGAGTGIAPLRSLILEREAIRARAYVNDSSDPVNEDGDNLLVFGCRKENMDYYYRDEWKALVERNHLQLWTAFSRDQWHKIYVQQVARDAKEGKLIPSHILQQQGAVYVAGGAKMARYVKDEILQCLAKEVGEHQASLFLKKLNRIGRYSVEAWN